MSLELLNRRTPNESNDTYAERLSFTGRATAVRIIGAASGMGGIDKACAAGPDVVKRFGIASALRQRGVAAVWEDILRPDDISDLKASLAPAKSFCAALAAKVGAITVQRERFVVIGGDHSCAIGTWSGVASAIRDQGPLGMVWIDAHMDSHTPSTSPSGALHGMPLACLLGYGDPALTGLIYPGPKLLPEHVCLIGVRSFEEEELRLLERLGVRVIHMQEVQHSGLAAAIGQALRIARHHTAGFGISLDLDAIDPSDAPGVGTPEPGGLCGRELVDCLASVADATDLLGIEMAEYNPRQDRDELTVRLTRDLLLAALGGT